MGILLIFLPEERSKSDQTTDAITLYFKNMLLSYFLSSRLPKLHSEEKIPRGKTTSK